MATFVKIPRKKGFGWQAIIRKAGQSPIKRTFDLKSEAQHWAAEQEALIKAKKYKDPRLAEKVSLHQALGKYREEGFLAGKAATTMEREVFSRNNLERLISKETALSDISAVVVNKYQQDRLHEGASNSSIRQELAMLSKMFNKARRTWGIPIENPVDDVERVKPGKARDRFLSKEEARIVLKEAKKSKNPHFYPFVLLLMHTGMRTGEAAKLHHDSIDYKNRTITIKQTKSGQARNVPVTQQVLDALKLISTEGYYFLSSSHLQSEPILLRPGNIFRRCWEFLDKRLKKANYNIPPFTPHDIRHTAASHLLMAGTDIRIIADILGHSTLQMAMRYTHTQDRHLQDVVDKISYLGIE